jgi:hypothetical protein
MYPALSRARAIVSTYPSSDVIAPMSHQTTNDPNTATSRRVGFHQPGGASRGGRRPARASSRRRATTEPTKAIIVIAITASLSIVAEVANRLSTRAWNDTPRTVSTEALSWE